MDLFSQIDTEPIQQRIDELTQRINHYNYEYYINDNSLISDYNFDKLLEELISLECQYPDLADPNSPTKRVGGDVIKSFKQVEHRFPMLSLANTYSISDIEEFELRTRKLLGETSFSYTCELKYDGVAIGLTYRNGKLVQAVTRGNGTIGDDITTNARTIKTIPLHLHGSFPADFEARGEVVYPFEAFNQMNLQREAEGDEPFANPRNAASGSLKLQNSSECAQRKLMFCMYFMMFPENTDAPIVQIDTHYHRLEWAKQMGFNVQPYITECKDINDIKAYIDYWDTQRWNLPYAVDGIVIKVNQTQLWDQLGMTAKSPRWAIAYKFKAQQVSTPILSVSYQVGRTGVITPVANLQPVWLGGTTVKRATLNNADFISTMDIREGDHLLVEKGGEIIPKIVGVDMNYRQPDAQPIRYISVCPECGTPLVRAEGEAGYYCPNQDGCNPQRIGMLEHFVSRKAMNIDSLGTERLQALYQAHLVTHVADLYDLKPEQLIGLTLQGQATLQQKSADNIITAINNSKQVPFERVLFALGIRFVGEVGAKKLARYFKNINALMQASVEELAQVEDVGEKTAMVVYDYFREAQHQSQIARLKVAGLQFEIVDTSISQKLYGKTIVVSGIFSHFSREEIKASIESHGGKVSSSLSSKTSYLVAGEKMGPEKLKKAEKLNIEIITENQYLEMIQ